jgi:hypothetical protein
MAKKFDRNSPLIGAAVLQRWAWVTEKIAAFGSSYRGMRFL